PIFPSFRSTLNHREYYRHLIVREFPRILVQLAFLRRIPCLFYAFLTRPLYKGLLMVFPAYTHRPSMYFLTIVDLSNSQKSIRKVRAGLNPFRNKGYTNRGNSINTFTQYSLLLFSYYGKKYTMSECYSYPIVYPNLA